MRWIPRTKASNADLWCFFDLRLKKRLSKQSWGWWFETLSRQLWRHCNSLTHICDTRGRWVLSCESESSKPPWFGVMVNIRSGSPHWWFAVDWLCKLYHFKSTRRWQYFFHKVYFDSTFQWCRISGKSSQISGNSTVYSAACSGRQQRNPKRSVVLTFVRGDQAWHFLT